VILVAALGFYCIGASAAERFINYQTWPKIDSASFRAYHHAQQPWILAFIVVPEALLFALQIWLWDRRPPGVGDWTMALLLTASVVGALSTVFLQIPIHRQLDQFGYSDSAYRALINTDWVRKACDVARGVLLVTMLKGFLRPSVRTVPAGSA
jgi:hypothetical protein